MDNNYLQQLIDETVTRGGGMVLNMDGKPAVVVLSAERYNSIVNNQLNETTMPKLTEKMSVVKSKVLVTGGAGYIGGHLVNELLKSGFEVVVLDDLSTGRRENANKKAVFVEGSLGDENLLKDLFSTYDFEAVFHMAASLEVEESVREPQKYFENNVVNTAKLLKAMYEGGCGKIIFSSTAAVYGESLVSPITEITPLKPNNPYGSTKLLAERVIKYYCEFLGFKATIFRYFNACGFDLGADVLPTHQSHLIYNVLMVAKGERPALQVFGNDYKTKDGTCVRDYVHVLDIVQPHILALEKMDKADKFELYNIGTSKGHSVLEVANTASEIIGKIIPMEVAPRRAGDAAVTVADNTKLKNILGYNLQHSSLENMLKTSWEVINRL